MIRLHFQFCSNLFKSFQLQPLSLSLSPPPLLMICRISVRSMSVTPLPSILSFSCIPESFLSCTHAYAHVHQFHPMQTFLPRFSSFPPLSSSFPPSLCLSVCLSFCLKLSVSLSHSLHSPPTWSPIHPSHRFIGIPSKSWHRFPLTGNSF